ncbi:hypothetical protein EJ04DRAFT_578288 [Polyplosphaeria fusca]|uniref:Uncharacterized protein n=1 Tax=Polyplosphaeria fusca TaxID=682080 RepID=A0A9P4QWT4_9PLEO|nr:hypothetical protein EJ04DRAFT_578288 [Polyplosphaeria fusca]
MRLIPTPHLILLFTVHRNIRTSIRINGLRFKDLRLKLWRLASRPAYPAVRCPAPQRGYYSSQPAPARAFGRYTSYGRPSPSTYSGYDNPLPPDYSHQSPQSYSDYSSNYDYDYGDPPPAPDYGHDSPHPHSGYYSQALPALPPAGSYLIQASPAQALGSNEASSTPSSIYPREDVPATVSDSILDIMRDRYVS